MTIITFSFKKARAAFLICAALAVYSVAISGCGSLPEKPDETSHLAKTPDETSQLARIFKKSAEQNEAHSGFILLRNGDRALYERGALADIAEHTIDAQYYIWNSDKSGRYLAQKLIEAADRGVSVRILLDDFSIGDRNQQLLAVSSHPNIEVRVFNPFVKRSGLAKWLNFAVDFERLNRRMHNKSYTVDGTAAIVGGRNIGDEYFNRNEKVNFRDLDLFTVGPVVTEISEEFQEYWTSPWAIPIDLIVQSNQGTTGRQQLAELVAAHSAKSLEFLFPEVSDSPRAHFINSADGLVWAPATFVYDRPGGSDETAYPEGPKRVASYLLQLAENSKEEVLVESAYFVLDDLGLDLAGRLRDRGIKMRALTNSMASNDVLPNHVSYAMAREKMLEKGIELHELRPDAESCPEAIGRAYLCDADSFFGLHAKTAVFDRNTIYVGSFNLNLRSTYLNSEVGMFVDSPVLAKQLIAEIEVNMTPENSWRPILKDHNVVWVVENDGVEEIVVHEPQTSFTERVKEGVLTLVPGAEYY